MQSEDQLNPEFKTSGAYLSDEGLVLVCIDEAEAQRAFCEAQLTKQGNKIKINGNEITLLNIKLKNNNAG